MLEMGEETIMRSARKIGVWLIIASLSCASIEANSETSWQGWLEEAAVHLEKERESTVQFIAKTEVTITNSEKLVLRAQAKQDTRSESIARQALATARLAKEKALSKKLKIEEEIAKVKALLEKLRSGTADEELRACNAVYAQLKQDIEATKRYQKTIDTTLKELDEWTEANQEAQLDALVSGVNALTGACLAELEARFDNAKALQRCISRHEKKLISKNKGSIIKIMNELELTTKAYNKAGDTIKKFTIAKYTATVLDGIEYFDQIMNLVSVELLSRTANDKKMKELLDDSDVKDIINQERPDVDLTLFIAEKSLEADKSLEALCKKAGMKTVPVSFAAFVADYGYNATKWALSRGQILRNCDLSEQELKAVDALKKQMERTMEKFKKCKAAIISREGISN
jgi:hypothetical protein